MAHIKLTVMGVSQIGDTNICCSKTVSDKKKNIKLHRQVHILTLKEFCIRETVLTSAVIIIMFVFLGEKKLINFLTLAEK